MTQQYNTITITKKAWIKAVLHTKGFTAKPHSDVLYEFITQLGGESKSIYTIAKELDRTYSQVHKVVMDLVHSSVMTSTDRGFKLSDEFEAVLGKDGFDTFLVKIN